MILCEKIMIKKDKQNAQKFMMLISSFSYMEYKKYMLFYQWICKKQTREKLNEKQFKEENAFIYYSKRHGIYACNSFNRLRK